jgi:hypothetical protein
MKTMNSFLGELVHSEASESPPKQSKTIFMLIRIKLSTKRVFLLVGSNILVINLHYITLSLLQGRKGLSQ